MTLSPATLTRHELVGLPVRVTDATSPALVGIAGWVVRETTNTLVVGVARRPFAAASGASPDASGATADRTSDDESSEQTAVQGDERTDKHVPKRGATFEFAVPTDEAASEWSLGSTFELPWETTGTGQTRPAGGSGGCENVGYVTVDGARLVARPARRTERAGDTLWQSD